MFSACLRALRAAFFTRDARDTIIEFDEHGRVIRIGGEPWPPQPRTLRMKLIDNASRAPRMASVQAASVLALLSMIQTDALPWVQPLVPAEYWPAVTGIVSVLIVGARLVAQPAIGKG